MFNKFKTAPVATLISVMTVLFAVLVYLQGTGVVHGAAETWLTVVTGAINVLLGLYARSKVTPTADPKDDLGRELVPARLVPPPR